MRLLLTSALAATVLAVPALSAPPATKLTISTRLEGGRSPHTYTSSIEGCQYVVAPRRATIVGYRLGRRVRTVVEVGGCERLNVPLRTLRRFVVWSD